MRPSRLLAVGFVLSALLAPPAHAQKSDPLTGKRVRVTAPNFLDHRVTGVVSSFTAKGLVVEEEGTGTAYTMPLHAVARIDPFRGDGPASTAWYRGRLGGFVGAGLGLIAGAFVSQVSPHGFGTTVALSGAAGLAAGGLVGGVSGALRPAPRWSWVMNPWGYDPGLKPSR
jgi:hypothetical protein